MVYLFFFFFNLHCPLNLLSNAIIGLLTSLSFIEMNINKYCGFYQSARYINNPSYTFLLLSQHLIYWLLITGLFYFFQHHKFQHFKAWFPQLSKHVKKARRRYLKFLFSISTLTQLHFNGKDFSYQTSHSTHTKEIR